MNSSLVPLLWSARLVACLALLAMAGAASAQTVAPPATREELIQRARRQKQATLWPEHEGPMVARANALLDRGLVEGIRSGGGANGWQLVLAGTRANQGQTFGIGYRRSDLFRDALTVRTTARATMAGAFLVDLQATLNRLRVSDATFVDVYAKYERSPHMEFYGLGSDSRPEDRTNYLLETASGDVRGGYRFSRQLNAGFKLGTEGVHTGSKPHGDIPSIETIFDSTAAPGLFDDVRFASWGGFLGFDTRDLPTGPRRGGFYGVTWDRWVDLSTGKYSHRQLELDGQQFLPYFNETRVLALFVRARLAYAGSPDRVVPFYAQPTLGGSLTLRGFPEYRFYDNNAFMAAVEHRWYAFTGLEMALFLDAGKTVPAKGDLNFGRLNYSGGVGFRVRVQDAIAVRIDAAWSREGPHLIFSLTPISQKWFQ